jgi:DNA-binding GntR family transcriptional regulator
MATYDYTLGEPADPAAQPPTLADIVTQWLRSDIFNGGLQPGSQLAEEELASHYSISRGTMREVLRRLADEGTVVIWPHRGAFVRKLTAGDIREVYSLRTLLEVEAVDLALKTRAYSVPVITHLEHTLAQMTMLENSSDYAQLSSLDLMFHRDLARPCSHSMLLEALERALLTSRLCISRLKVEGVPLPPDAIRHNPILAAVIKGSRKEARESLVAHLEEAREALLRVTQSLPGVVA